MRPTFIRPLLALTLIGALYGCGSDEKYVGIDGSGAPVTTAVAGPINGFGSVIVGGIHYDTTNATFTISGKPGTEADLAVGSYITLEGYIAANGTRGFATHIAFQPAVSGTISSINSAGENFVVLGQTVQINGDTAFDFGFTPRDITGLSVGQSVQVSGAIDAAGRIFATRIGLAPKAPLEMTGQISQLNTITKTFNINGQNIDYGYLVDLPPLKEGEKIIIREGELFEQNLKPRTLEIDPGYKRLTSADSIVKSGLITRYISAADFYIDDIPVTTDGHTQFLDLDANSLEQNAHVSLSGHFVSGKLLAEKIQGHAESQWKIAGKIMDINNLTQSGGKILVQNSWIELNTSTRLDSEFAAAGNRMTLINLRIGDYVILTGRQQTGFVATSLEREESQMPQLPKQLRGNVSNLNESQNQFTLLDKYQVTTTGTTTFWMGQQLISAQEFYSSANQKLVEVRGILMEKNITAVNVRLINEWLNPPPPGPLPAPLPPETDPLPPVPAPLFPRRDGEFRY